MRPDELLREVIDTATPELLAVGHDASGRAPSPGKWCARQVIGHLIDSACNNHGRFVRAQFTDDLVFPGYDQEAWVTAQDYVSGNWADLIALWRGYNLHLTRIIAAIPETDMIRQRSRHNLHEIGWRPVAQDTPATLEDMVRDYIAHLEHHLTQVLPGYRPRSFDRATAVEGSELTRSL
jgi:DinB superfamily